MASGNFAKVLDLQKKASDRISSFIEFHVAPEDGLCLIHKLDP